MGEVEHAETLKAFLRRYRHNAHPGIAPSYRGNQLDPIAVGHEDVCDDDIGYGSAYSLKGLDTVAGFADLVPRIPQQAAGYLAERRIVINQQNQRQRYALTQTRALTNG